MRLFLPHLSLCLLPAVSLCTAARAQIAVPRAEILAGYAAANVLPDSPGYALERYDVSTSAVPDDTGIPFLTSKPMPPVAPKYKSRILAGQGAVPLSGRDKMIFSVRREATIGEFASNLFSAGWAHVTDSRPHYGSDSAGFGERLGAAEVRSFTKSLVGYGVLSAALHTDPRYYQAGDTKPFKTRLIYAATRVIVGRTDSGHATPNIAYIGGVTASSVLTNYYYPHRDRSAERTLAGIFTDMGGRMATLEWEEFGPDILQHLFHKP